jgi:hypothetical protein
VGSSPDFGMVSIIPVGGNVRTPLSVSSDCRAVDAPAAGDCMEG